MLYWPPCWDVVAGKLDWSALVCPDVCSCGSAAAGSVAGGGATWLCRCQEKGVICMQTLTWQKLIILSAHADASSCASRDAHCWPIRILHVCLQCQAQFKVCHSGAGHKANMELCNMTNTPALPVEFSPPSIPQLTPALRHHRRHRRSTSRRVLTMLTAASPPGLLAPL